MNTVICPHCKKPIELNDALSHEIKDKLRQEAVQWREKKELEFSRKLEETKVQLEHDLTQKAKKKLEEEISLKLKDTQNEALELKREKQELQTQLLELTKTLREMKDQTEKRELENQRKLMDERDKLKEEISKIEEEKSKYKILEVQKQLEDTKKALAEAQRKSEQKSQQLQGEVLELEFENILKQEFPQDELRPVAKGVRGGDLIQVVKNNYGDMCGTIIWEFKRTKSWSNEWIPKLKNDQRTLKAEIAVIISEIIPGDVKSFAYRDGVWVGDFQCVTGLAYALRNSLLEISVLKKSSENKSEKMEILYNYIYGTHFRQRVEAIIEAFTNLQSNVEKEKRWFASKWAKEETDIRRVLDNMFGLQGDIQSITGRELEDVDSVLLVETTTSSDQDTLL